MYCDEEYETMELDEKSSVRKDALTRRLGERT
jgi:hypothetical protein